jgi:hypothetical protein
MKARQRGRPVEPMDLSRIETALRHLQNARSYLRDAGSHNAAAYVQRALKSVQGAYNNASAKLAQQHRAEPRP